MELVTSEANLIVPFSYQLDQAAQNAGFQVNIVRRFTSFIELQVGQGENKLKIDLALDSPFSLRPG